MRWLRPSPPEDLAPAAAYARWAPSYPPSAHNVLMEIEERAMLAALGTKPNDARSALDLACGTGRYARLLGDRGWNRVVAFDASSEMLARAPRRAARFVRGDMRALPFAGATFDLVVCGLAVGDVADLAPVLAEAGRVLKPGAWLVYSDLHPRGAHAGWRRTFKDARGRPCAIQHHIHDLDDHYRACAGAGFVIDSILEPAIDPPHRFAGWPAAVVVRARKA